jgi:hypothetical protein
MNHHKLVIASPDKSGRSNLKNYSSDIFSLSQARMLVLLDMVGQSSLIDYSQNKQFVILNEVKNQKKSEIYSVGSAGRPYNWIPVFTGMTE